MTDDERREAVARLRVEWADAIARRDVLFAELKDVTENWIGPVRQAFGNPYFYSGGKHARPENAEHTKAKYTGYTSHEVVGELIRPTMKRLEDLKGEMQSIRARFEALGEKPPGP